MTLTFTTPEATLVIPGAYSTTRVVSEDTGLAANGIVILIGEADAGPQYALEDDLEANAYTPAQVTAMVSKYRSGPLVEAFRAACTPSADPNIPGAPALIIPVKTNLSTRASRTVLNAAGATYGAFADLTYGRSGNMIQTSVEAASAEALPTTGAFTFIPPVGTLNLEFRVNGGAAIPSSHAANVTPTAFVTAVNALAGVAATGGVDRVAHPVAGNISLTAVGLVATFGTTTAWAVVPSVGDTLVVPAASVLAGTGTDNVGAYVVTSANSTTIVATKISDAGQSGAVIGGPVSCVTVVSTAVGGTPASNLVVYSPVTITLEAGTVIDGVGKTLEIAELTTGTDLLSRTAFQLSATPVTWVSKLASAATLTSATEFSARLLASRQADGLSETIVAGGEPVLLVRYTGTTATLTITDTTLSTTVTGGAGTSLSTALADWATVADLAAWISAQPGYSAQPLTNAVGQLATTALDRVSAMGICSSFGALVGRVKADAFRFFTAVSTTSILVRLQTAAGVVQRMAAGLPAVTAVGFLVGGAKGGTAAADVVAALAACERVSGNFVVLCLARDASEDIADALTESSSTYTVDGAIAALKSHCLAMSGIKRRRNRQGFASKRTTFAAAKTAAGNLSLYRCALAFQDVKRLASDGTIKQFQPWMTAVLAASMQAAGFYRAIVAKQANCNAALQAARDFDDRDDGQVEDALKAGLLVLRRTPSGAYAWVSDNTTYTRDNNFVYNSIQAVYASDLIALTTAQRMELAFLGQSLADVSPALAKSYLEVTMADFKRLKLIAASADAPNGFRNAEVTISGPVMQVSLEVKLAGAIYFIPISFLVSQVNASA